MSSLISSHRVEIGIFILEGGLLETGSAHSRSWKQALDRLLKERAIAAGRAFVEFQHFEDYLEYVQGRSGLQGVRRFLASRGISLPQGEPADPPRMETLNGLLNEARENYRRRLERSEAAVSDAALDRLSEFRRMGLKMALLCRTRLGRAVSSRILDQFDVVMQGNEAQGNGIWGERPRIPLLEATCGAVGDPAKALVVVGEIGEAKEARQGGIGLVVGVGAARDREALARAGAHLVLSRPTEIDPQQIQVWAENRAHILPSALYHWKELRARYAGKRAAVFLDYDGTLTPIRSRPDRAVLASEGREVLAQAASRCPIAILSGRKREEVAKLVGLPNVSYGGSHGFDIVGPRGSDIRHRVGEAQLPGLGRARDELAAELTGRPGVLIEDKRFSVAIHHRNVAPNEWPEIEAVVDRVAAAHPGLQKFRGKLVLELRPDVDWDKGKALLYLLGELGLDEPGVIPLHIGDDVTDEDAFRAVKGRGFGVLVATHPRSTLADFFLQDSRQVWEFLARLGSIPRF